MSVASINIIRVDKTAERPTFEAFLALHELSLEITDRGYGDDRFVVDMPHVEIGGDGLLRSVWVDGPTEEAAIARLQQNITGRLLVVDAWKPTRREIRAPSVWTPDVWRPKR